MLKHYSKILALPFILLIVFLTLNYSWEIFNLPSENELVFLIETWFERYGLPIVFLSSIVEGALLVGGYFPGVFVIFIGVVLSKSVGQATLVVVVASIGLLIAHAFNYFLGKYGWYTLLVKFGLKGAVDDAQAKLSKRGPIAIFLSYWLPSLGALTDTAAGIIRLPIKVFFTYSILSTVIWNTIVGVGVYIVGDKALSIAMPGSGRSNLLYLGILAWALLIIIADYLERKYGNEKTEVDPVL